MINKVRKWRDLLSALDYLKGMKLDHDACYRAIQSRDRRFEGRFVVAVKTTGIYCRPGCPAPLPKEKNVLFFPCAAAAEAQGFRSCLRCRPNAVPETPAWNGTTTTVERAWRLIDGGALEEGGLEELAERLGVGSRHLRRLFVEHLGATPIALIQSRRVHFARRLLEETALPMTRVAEASGFSSLRRFNALMKATLHATPTEVRRRGKRAAAGPMTLRLSYKPPYDWRSISAFLAARAAKGVELATPKRYARTALIDNAPCIIEVQPIPGDHALSLRIHGAVPTRLIRVVGRVRSLFDLQADPLRIASALGPVAKHPGLRVPGCWDRFELVVRAVLGQQISVQAASTLASQIALRYGQKLPPSVQQEGLNRLFPTPERLARARLQNMMPKRRAETIRTLAKHISEGTLDLERPAPDIDKQLQHINGVGPWTANYVAMRAFGEADAFPRDDLGLRKALDTSAKELGGLAEGWRPFRAYAAMQLWRSL